MKPIFEGIRIQWCLNFLVPFVLIATSCTSDDVEDLLNKPLEGTTWTLSQRTVSSCRDEGDNSTESCTNDCQTLVMESGTFTVTEPGEPTFVASYTVSGNIITMEYEENGQTETESKTYAITLNQLVVTCDADEDGCIDVSTYTGS